MEPTINNINEPESIDETETAEAIELEASEVDSAETEIRELPFGRGRRGKFGRRPFGPNRPYRFALFVEEDGSYVLRSPDLSADAVPVASLDEVGATMQAAIAERAAEDAKAAEEAAKDAEYSGKFVLRLPRSMHRQLAELAEAEGVSLNQLALTFLAQGMGKVDAIEEFGKRRGPKGGHRGPGGHGPRDGHGGHGPKGSGPEGRDFDRRHWGKRGPEERLGGRSLGFGLGFDRERGRGGRGRGVTGLGADTAPIDPEGARLV